MAFTFVNQASLLGKELENLPPRVHFEPELNPLKWKPGRNLGLTSALDRLPELGFTLIISLPVLKPPVLKKQNAEASASASAEAVQTNGSFDDLAARLIARTQINAFVNSQEDKLIFDETEIYTAFHAEAIGYENNEKGIRLLQTLVFANASNLPDVALFNKNKYTDADRKAFYDEADKLTNQWVGYTSDKSEYHGIDAGEVIFIQYLAQCTQQGTITELLGGYIIFNTHTLCDVDTTKAKQTGKDPALKQLYPKPEAAILYFDVDRGRIKTEENELTLAIVEMQTVLLNKRIYYQTSPRVEEVD